MPQIKPNHDFLGLIGIEFEEGLRLYGVAPRFWYKRYSPEVQNLEGSTVRILRQKENVDFGNDELARKECTEIEKNMQRIKTNYQQKNLVAKDEKHDEESNEEETSENIQVDSENVDESSKELLESDFKSEDVLISLFNLCEFYRKNQKEELLIDSEFSSNSLPLFQYEKFIEKL